MIVCQLNRLPRPPSVGVSGMNPLNDFTVRRHLATLSIDRLEAITVIELLGY